MRASAPLQRRTPDAGYVDSESGGGEETGDGNDKRRRSSCFARHRSSFTTGAFLAVAVLCVVWHVRARAQKEAMEAQKEAMEAMEKIASSPSPTPSHTSRSVHAHGHERRHDPSAAITRNPLPASPPPTPAKAVSAEGGGTGAAGSGAKAEAAGRPARSEELLSEGKPVTSDVRGNLGEASVVTSPKVDDWLKDRWQVPLARPASLGSTDLTGKEF